ncbi:unnamed protein product [Rotaria sordida]|uniref:Uncharacterized protein n=1 Tax=Rotaria sordida TaxID=392033 RepID=A0A819UB65_9BILA|nr:unnamed protein product [Rotaria sordida]CAF1529070.1 unnamed protein product [Rotaria sordida]CAF4091297.1 unnamed protein product [Rotaria sordida]CAF4130618.1 unnamed protein product [Rotaria sordida]
MGQLIIPFKEDQEQESAYSTSASIWPNEIKRMIKENSINTNKTNENEIYMNFVTNHLHELDHHLHQYEIEMNKSINNFYGYTLTIQNMLETYLQQNRSSLCMKIEHKTELVYYDYQIRTLKLAYNHHNPNLYQVCIHQ